MGLSFTKKITEQLCHSILIRHSIIDKRAKLGELLKRMEEDFQVEGREQAIQWGEEYFQKESV